MENKSKTSSSETDELFIPGEGKPLELEPTSVQDLVTLSKQYEAARVEAEAAAQLKKEADKRLHSIEARFWEELLEAGIDKLPRQDGITFERAEKLWYKVDDEEAFLEHLRETGEINDYTKTAWEAARINAMIKELHGKGEPLPPGLNFSLTRYISRTTRSRAKKTYGDASKSKYKGDGDDGEAFEIG